MQIVRNRRSFLTGLSAITAASLLSDRTAYAEDEPVETKTVRFGHAPDSPCVAPVYLAKALLQTEGFELHRIVTPSSLDEHQMMQRDELDFSWAFASAWIRSVDIGLPVKVLSGLHAGCYELFGRENVHSVLDLKGMKVSAGPQVGSEERLFISAMATYVGLDPINDIEWVTDPSATPMQLFIDGKVDAFLSFPPEVQEVHTRKVDRVVVSGTLDHPWSQYFCCMVGSSATYAERYPVATKRMLRAILKATDFCVTDPALAARTLIDAGDAKDYDLTLQSLSDVPYAKWREYDPEDTIRFFALRLHEAGIIKTSPQTIIDRGTDWRFLDELKREMKT